MSLSNALIIHPRDGSPDAQTVFVEMKDTTLTLYKPNAASTHA